VKAFIINLEDMSVEKTVTFSTDVISNASGRLTWDESLDRLVFVGRGIVFNGLVNGIEYYNTNTAACYIYEMDVDLTITRKSTVNTCAINPTSGLLHVMVARIWNNLFSVPIDPDALYGNVSTWETGLIQALDGTSDVISYNGKYYCTSSDTAWSSGIISDRTDFTGVTFSQGYGYPDIYLNRFFAVGTFVFGDGGVSELNLTTGIKLNNEGTGSFYNTRPYYYGGYAYFNPMGYDNPQYLYRVDLSDWTGLQSAGTDPHPLVVMVSKNAQMYGISAGTIYLIDMASLAIDDTWTISGITSLNNSIKGETLDGKEWIIVGMNNSQGRYSMLSKVGPMGSTIAKAETTIDLDSSIGAKYIVC
jgi:hypothetical protein